MEALSTSVPAPDLLKDVPTPLMLPDRARRVLEVLVTDTLFERLSALLIV